MSRQTLSVESIQCPVLMVASSGTRQGKTTVTALLARLHRNCGRRVQVFKTGPDFLDPMIHQCASGQAVFNLDLWMVGETEIRQRLHRAASHNDLIIIECAMGLFDGQMGVDGKTGNRSADLAILLGIPVVVVIDAQGIAQTFGALAHGLQSFQPDLPFAGVVANGVGSVHHFELIKQGVPDHIPLLAGIPREPRLRLPERHLGLVQADEMADLDGWLNNAVELLLSSDMALGIDRLPKAVSFSQPNSVEAIEPKSLAGRRIAIARDHAFSFIYPANVELLAELGAELRFFSPLDNEPVPDCDGVWLPGGYPELFADQLSGCRLTQRSLKALVDNNTPVLAECGGLLFLLEQLITVDGIANAMSGLLPGKAVMRTRFQGLGLQTMPWPEGELRGHTFHHSELLSGTDLSGGGGNNPLEAVAYATRQRNAGRGEALYQHGSIRGSYFHAYFPSNRAAISRFFSA